MPTRRKKRISRRDRRRRSAGKVVGTDWKSLPPDKIKEALDAIYATEGSRLDPLIERMMATALALEDW